MQHAINASPQGRALRTATMWGAYQATRDFFRLPLLESWFAAVRRLLLELRPAVLLLTSFVSLSGAAALPALLGLPTRVVLAHTIPMQLTGAFGVPLAGTGFTAPAAWLNRLQWQGLEAAVGQALHLPRAQQLVDRAAAEMDAAEAAAEAEAEAGGRHHDACSTAGGSRSHCLKLHGPLTLGPVPTLYIYSAALLPKPADWPENCVVVGPLLLRRQALAQQAQRAAAAEVPAPGQQIAAEPLPTLHLQLPRLRKCSSSGTSTSSSSSNGSDAATPSPGTPMPQAEAAQALREAQEERQQDRPGRAASAPAIAGVALPAAASAECVGLPAALQDYLDAAGRWQRPVVYIGLGSMLGTVFEPAEASPVVAPCLPVLPCLALLQLHCTPCITRCQCSNVYQVLMYAGPPLAAGFPMSHAGQPPGWLHGGGSGAGGSQAASVRRNPHHPAPRGAHSAADSDRRL